MLIVQGLIHARHAPPVTLQTLLGHWCASHVYLANMLQVMECLNVVYAVLHYTGLILLRLAVLTAVPVGLFRRMARVNADNAILAVLIQLFTTAVKIAVQACTQTESTVRV